MTSTVTGAEAAVQMLQQHGVKHIFGLCGDTSLPFYDALYRLDHGMEHILTRDERSASYMADAYARVTGKVGICEGPSGGGATYILPGVIEANESSSAVLSITSDVPVTARGRYPLTELDQKALFAPLTKWNAVVDHVTLIPHIFRTAFRAMTTGRPGAAHIGLPYDLQKQTLDAAQIWAQPQHRSFPAFRTGPDPDMVAAAADVILAARRPAFICGGGAIISGATAELVALAELLDAPVASTISGHGVISDDHPLAVGVVGANGGTDQTREAIADADTVIFIGCRAGSTTTEHGTAPKRNIPIVHIDVDPMVVGANYQIEAGIVGDALLCLRALGAEISRRLEGKGRNTDAAARLSGLRAAKRAAFERLAHSTDAPIRPERVLAALQKALPADSIVVADPGTPCPYVSGHFNFNSTGRRFITNRAHGALGFSLPASVGAWYGSPSSKVIALMGDGSFGFAVGEMETMVRKGVPITMIVFSNSSFGWIKASQKDGYGERYFSVDFNRSHHARIAEAFGVKAWQVSDPADLDAVLRAAIAHDGPTLIDVISQPLEESAVPVSTWMG
ncbi:acetolactate synthase [Sphingobium sp. 22B]|uniref:thiamine pyrophosphate-binding protein n=1 Tax=unclassified Sphingobium TaxID=2611147 RepID=UPI0007829DA2|nr:MULTISPECIES: thiamine pyrophosphate-binding protein [unclassified Sphingobium]KXU31511.1 acetolactate synthase [Sphingobium sp. AM]KYC31165.1 acetolactate synthase [Sphingobium sp. 22B]OAP31166.1 acetolactate synthase [Sphingobium sp. 20006FA]